MRFVLRQGTESVSEAKKLAAPAAAGNAGKKGGKGEVPVTAKPHDKKGEKKVHVM